MLKIRLFVNEEPYLCLYYAPLSMIIEYKNS